MKKITITVGVSGSGKSTWAHEQWKENPLSTVVVNRDKIRELLFGFTEESVKDYYSLEGMNSFEKQITKYEDVLINEALIEGKHVIVDATHLRKEYITRFEFWNVPTEVKFFDITLKEALTRNMGRVRQVSEEIIKKQYQQFLNIREEKFTFEVIELKQDKTLQPVYLLDVDGTIANMNGKRGAFDWKNVGVDDLDESLSPVIEAINAHSGGGKPKVIVVSGRDTVCKPETVDWLAEHGVGFHDIFMRPMNDYRPDWKIKEEIWRELSKEYNILGLFDDRLQVVRRARSLGLKVFNVEYNNF